MSEIYHKKTDFVVKTYFLALNFNMSARQTAEDATMFMFANEPSFAHKLP